MKTENGYRKKLKRSNVQGQAHYLTFSCYHNQPFLNRDRSRFWFIDSLKKARDKYQFELWAWVIMPEHVHLLILPNDGTEIQVILKSLKLSVGKTASKWVKENSPEFLPKMTEIKPNKDKTIRFWQRGGGYDRNIFSIEEIYEKINYIHKNPVRKGLVNHPEDWVWSSYRAYEKNDNTIIDLNKDSLPPLRI